jgi:hypothetical protein
MAKYGTGKQAIVRETRKQPAVLAQYRAVKRGEKHLPLTHEDIASLEGKDNPDWDAFVQNVQAIPVGRPDADRYEKAIEGLLTALFYPNLTNPTVQHKIHDDRKRIDITYTNMALNGFFSWVATHYPAPHVFVECKNYGKEVGNPELDQLAGRFSPSRGVIGLLVCRKFENKARFIQRCADTARDSRGFILPLDDDDLVGLIAARKSDPLYSNWPLLQRRFQDLVS